jgi:uncharacterized protein (TIGR03435 family)
MRLSMMSRCRVPAGLAALSLLCVAPVRAQLILPENGEPLPSFEVATIKPAAADVQGMRIQWMPDGYRMDNVSLNLIIRNAYGVRSDGQIVGGPEALLDQHFDVQAKMDADAAAQLKALPREEQRRREALMMQALLRDRFQLKIHVEQREQPVFALLVAKGGPKLQTAAPAAPEPAPEQAKAVQPPNLADPLPQRPPKGTWMMRVTSTKAEMTVSGGTMEQLASTLSGQQETEAHVVIDKTGLTGKYDWYLTWTPADAPTSAEQKGVDGSPAGPDAPGLLTALQEQLGLRLEAQKGPVQVVVIEHLEPPSPN